MNIFSVPLSKNPKELKRLIGKLSYLDDLSLG